MAILRQLTESESDLTAKEQLILRAGEATHHLACVLSATNTAFWSLPTDRLLAVLNKDIPTTLATFEANSRLGMQVNASLNALGVPHFSNRAPVELGRLDIKFDGTKFIQSAPPP
jgi:hypothetical protein